MRSKPAFLVLAMATALILSACGGAPTLSQQDLLETAVILQALTALAEAEDTATPAPATPEPAATEATPAPSDTPEGPVVVFLAAGSFSADEDAQIRSRVVNPFTHYYRDLEGHPPLVSFTVEKISGVAGYPYSANAIFETGINAGFLISASGGVVDWWLPECMVACSFSDSFRAAYPEIVAILEP
jgi:hypothetical protein